MKIRIKFSKTGNLKYIGHLDIMRCFQKVMRRAEVDIAYSAGFSPHQIMSFASPLGLGLTSEGEYVDIEVNSTESSARMLERINAAMVDGMTALSYVKLPDDAKTAMSVVAAADYLVNFDQPVEDEIKAKFQEFLKQKSIVISKSTKKQELEMEIRPLIFEARFVTEELSSAASESGQMQKDSLFMQVSSGSAANLKPEMVLEAFCDWAGIEASALPYHIHRLEMYADLIAAGMTKAQRKRAEEKRAEGKKLKYKLIPLDQMGEVIE